MNPSAHSFTVSVGDKVTDTMTGLTGICSGLIVYSDLSKGAAIDYLASGKPETSWVNVGRLKDAA